MAVDRLGQAEALVRKVREQLTECRTAYNSLLEKQTVRTDLRSNRRQWGDVIVARQQATSTSYGVLAHRNPP
jgi:hypothetical protein